MCTSSDSFPYPVLSALDRMQAILRSLGAEQKLENLYAAAVEKAAAFFQATQCVLLLYDSHDGTLRPASPCIGLDEAQVQALIAAAPDRLPQLIAACPPHGVIPLFAPEYAALVEPSLIAPLQESDVLVAMVRVEGRVIGLLRLANKSDGTPFSQLEAHLLGFFASQLGLLIHNLQMLAKEQRQRHLAETLLQVPQVVRQPIFTPGRREILGEEDFRHQLTRLLELLNEVINYSSASVALLRGDLLYIAAARGYTLAPNALSLSWKASSDPKFLEIMETGRLLHLPDTHRDPRWQKWEGSERIRAWIGVPIWAPTRAATGRDQSTSGNRGELIGILNVDGDRPLAFDDTDLAVAQAFADQIAIVLENQCLYTEAAQRAQELALLNQITTAINSALSLDEILNLILGHLKALIRCDRASIAFLEGSDLRIAGTIGFPADLNVVGHTYPWDSFPLNKEVIESKRPIAIPDVLQEPRWVVSESMAHVRAWLGIPLAYGGKVVGLLTLTSSEPVTYSLAELQLVSAIAEQAALAIEKARLLSEMQDHLARAEKRSRELAVIGRASSILNASLELETVLQNTVNELARALGVEQCGLVLFDWTEGVGRVVAEYQSQPDESAREVLIPVEGNASMARILETKAPLAIRDALHDPLLANVRDVIIKRRIKSMLILPIIVRGEVIGTIGLDALDAMRDFTPDEISLAQTITNQAATAIANAQLYAEAKRRAAQLQTIQEVTRHINAILDPEELLFRVSNLLSERFGYYMAHIFLVDESGEYVVDRGGSGEIGRRLAAEGFRLRIGAEGLCGWVAAYGQSALVNDVHEDPRYFPHPLLPDTRAELVVPIKLGDKVLGVLDVNSERKGAFDEADRFLLETLADQVAVALENARLYKALEERAHQLEIAYEEVRTLDRMKDEFLQTVSHELRTPLTFVKGYLELLLEGAFGELSSEQADALNIVARRTDNIIHLVNDIITLLRAEYVELKLQPIDLGEVARASVEGARGMGEQAGVRLELDVPAGLPLVLGDSQRLGQVFDNLLNNAIKFSPNGGTIRVRLLPGDDVVRAEVIDQGIGIPADKLERIWERFYQVEGTATRRFVGTGLGLAIVKRLVEAHGGQVGVESVVGQGSTFYFTVPRAGVTSPAHVGRASSSPTTHGAN